jgi:hypothetical protein
MVDDDVAGDVAERRDRGCVLTMAGDYDAEFYTPVQALVGLCGEWNGRSWARGGVGVGDGQGRHRWTGLFQFLDA